MSRLQSLRLALLLSAAALPGCVAAAAAGAGAATGIYLTSRGASGLITGSIEQLAARTQSVFREMNIQQTAAATDNGGDKREFKGTQGDREITVSLERKSPTTTNVEVTARKNLAEWDKDLAKSILQRIAAKS